MDPLELKGDHEGETEQREAVKFVSLLQELSGSTEDINEPKAQEDPTETSMATGKKCMFNICLHCCIATKHMVVLPFMVFVVPHRLSFCFLAEALMASDTSGPTKDDKKR